MFLSRCNFRCNGSLIVNFVILIFYTINFINQMELFWNKRSCYYNILSRHSLRYFTPPRECIMLSGRCCFWGNRVIIVVDLDFVIHTVHLVGNGIFTRHETTTNDNIFIRHFGRKINPSSEFETILCRIRFWSNVCIIVYIIRFILNPVHIIDQIMMID